MELIKEKGIITIDHIKKGISYREYRELIDVLLGQGKTSGEDHSEKMLAYTRLNVKRMSKWDKISKIEEDLHKSIEAIGQKQNWLVLTEAWCGDAAQNLPVINKLAALNENINLKFIFRDENMEVMDAYLTEGGRSIPKLIILDQDLIELGTWGPRPEPVQLMLRAFKQDDSMTYDDFAHEAHLWYGQDRQVTLQRELRDVIESIR